MADEKERVTKLENRSREAEAALQQLGSYVELLKTKKSGDLPISAEALQLEAENAELKREVQRLKQQLILEEISNGVEQYPVPKDIVAPTTAAKVPPPTTETPPTTTTEALPTTTTKKPATTASGNSAPPKKEKVKAEKKKPGGGEGNGTTPSPIDVSRLDMRVGKILKAWKHPDADGLYVEEVDVGDEGRIRTICSGLVKHVPLEEMQGRLGVFLCNLKTAKMRGVPSEGMIMCANTPEKVEILDPPAGSVPGERVFCAGYEGTPDKLLNPKKKIFETVQPHLQTNEEGVACYKDGPFTVAGRGVCRSQTMKGSAIK